MNQKCNPVQKKGERNIFCPYYGACLDHAVKESWEDWDCGECDHKIKEDRRWELQFTADDTMPYYEVAGTIGRGR